ncbi:hypothetical protein TruAng_002063 [Truncatella angustata]|nr:hypothetical protein TruAng_002063 [Truncatella angustata]
MHASLVLLLAAAHLATAHFGIEFPEWRADTLTDEDGPYSQYDYPCGNVPAGVGNRTDWPLNGGGVVSLDLHHAWTYVFINVGLGDNVTNFNISLTPDFYNVTGNGTFCLPDLTLPEGIGEGTNASIQVVTSGKSGSALYNVSFLPTFLVFQPAVYRPPCIASELCADIRLVANAVGPADGVCVNTTKSAVVVSQFSTTSSNTTNTTSSSGSSTSSGTSAAAGISANLAAVTGFTGMAVLLAVCMGV